MIPVFALIHAPFLKNSAGRCPSPFSRLVFRLPKLEGAQVFHFKFSFYSKLEVLRAGSSLLSLLSLVFWYVIIRPVLCFVVLWRGFFFLVDCSGFFFVFFPFSKECFYS